MTNTDLRSEAQIGNPSRLGGGVKLNRLTRICRYLRDQENPCRVRTIAYNTGIPNSTTQNAINWLLEFGLVTRIEGYQSYDNMYIWNKRV